MNRRRCEEQMDIFLTASGYDPNSISNNLLATITTTTHSDYTPQEKNITFTERTAANDVHSLHNHTTTMGTCTQPLMALGILVGLLVVLLITVITGWVWTCWILIRREGKKVGYGHNINK